MAQLLVRQLPDDVKEALRERARANGRSMEAEARAILTDLVRAETSVQIEYDGRSSPENLLENYGVKVLPAQAARRTVTHAATQALIDELV